MFRAFPHIFTLIKVDCEQNEGVQHADVFGFIIFTILISHDNNYFEGGSHKQADIKNHINKLKEKMQF